MIPLPRRFPLPRRHRLARGGLPLGLLLLALAPVFVFGNDRSQFYREAHGGGSARPLAIAANLSAEHGFLLFERQKQGPDGGVTYVHHDRLPTSSYVLVKLAILPFGDDFPKAIRAARLLMLAFFAASAVLAYLALARLLGDRRIALAATLLAFSSYYLLYHNDAVSTETSIDLFGVMLVFHGMVLFVQEGRFRQLLAKTAVALLLGWHVVGLIAPFVLFALGRKLLAARANGGGVRPEDERRLRPRAILAYGAFSALCAALVLGFHLGNEYRAFGGEVPLHELPSFDSLLRRSGMDPAGPGLGAGTFLQTQLGRIGAMAIPFAAADRLGLEPVQLRALPPPLPLAAAGAAALAACAAGLRFLPRRTLFAALPATGWCWAILFRKSTGDEFEAMFHLGVPLVFWALVLLGLRRLGGRRAARALTAAALASMAVFALSAHDMGRIGHDAVAAQQQRETTSDFRAMRPFTTGRTVLFGPSRESAGLKRLSYWLHGSYLEPNAIGSAEEWAAAPRYDYVALPVDLGSSLTPHNRRFHLYTPAALDAVYASIATREPDARSEFEVHLDGRSLTWVREECDQDEVWPFLFVHAVLLDPNDLPPDRRLAGFVDREYFFGYLGLRFGGRCIGRLELRKYPLAGIRTGQRQGDLPPIWEVSFPVGDPSFPRGVSTWRETATAGEPAASSAFDVYLEDGALTYVREGCAAADAADRFFVHAYAADPGDLPTERQASGFEILDFRFRDRGVRYGGDCMARIELPDYGLRAVRTGQYDASGPLWDVGFAPDAEAWLARFEAAAASPPALRAKFDLRLDGRALTLVREACSAADVADRFFVHVYTADGDAREAIDFWFGQRGVLHGERCMAQVALPDYGIARVVAGQYGASGHLWEAELALGDASE